MEHGVSFESYPAPRSAHEALVAADRYAISQRAQNTTGSQRAVPAGVSINHPSIRQTAPLSEVEIGKGTPDEPTKMITFAEKQLRRMRDRILSISSATKRGGGSSSGNVKKGSVKTDAVKSEEDSQTVTPPQHVVCAVSGAKVLPLPDDADTNLSGCAHCTEVSHCDCAFLEGLLEEVYDGLSLKRIVERASATSTPAHTPSNSNASTPRKPRDPQQAAAEEKSLTSTGSTQLPMPSSGAIYASAEDASCNSAASSTTARAVAAAPGRSGRHLCAKSLLTPFVARLARLQAVTSSDVYYDLGCGNGSILFQIAYSTGAACIGVELCPHNAQIARDAWEVLRPILEKRSGRAMPPVYIITGDICNVIDDPQFISAATAITTTAMGGGNGETQMLAPTPKRKILLSNLLFPKMLTQYISQQCRRIAAIGSSIACFDDLYPHGRSLCQKRDPEAFELFHMRDFLWPENSVEWCRVEGHFYIHERK